MLYVTESECLGFSVPAVADGYVNIEHWLGGTWWAATEVLQ